MLKAGIVMKIVVITVALLPALMVIASLPLNLYGLGILSGWLGAGLISASLLLMIREPGWTARFDGLQRMYQWHHSMGVAGYGLLLTHPLLLASSYFEVDLDTVWEYLSPFNPDILNRMGWIGLAGFMLGLAATFSLRLPYSWWRRLHMLLVVAMLIGLGHIGIAGGFSVSLMIVLLITVVAMSWRLVRSDYGAGSFPYEVSAVSHPSEHITEVALRPLAKPIRIAHGQFVNTAFFEGPLFQGCGEFHPYTVSKVAEDGSLSLSVKALGDCTQHIQALEPGVAARLQGPYGVFLLDRPSSPVIWIAGGIGITPFLAMLRSHLVTQKTDLIYVHSELEQIPYEEELRAYATDQALFHVHSLAMEKNPMPLFTWLENIDDLNERKIYLCGPPLLVEKITGWLQEQGVPEQQIHFEQFDFRA
jgi:predicted ferric reductase